MKEQKGSEQGVVRVETPAAAGQRSASSQSQQRRVQALRRGREHTAASHPLCMVESVVRAFTALGTPSRGIAEIRLLTLEPAPRPPLSRLSGRQECIYSIRHCLPAYTPSYNDYLPSVRLTLIHSPVLLLRIDQPPVVTIAAHQRTRELPTSATNLLLLHSLALHLA